MPTHFVYSRESQFGTWVTPATWIHVEEAGIQSRREHLDKPYSGMQRDLGFIVPGAKPVNGPLTTPWWCVGVGALLRTFMQSLVTTNPLAGVYDHAMLYDDTVGLGSISGQEQYVTTGLDILSAVCASWTLSLVAKEEARLSFNMEAKDEAVAGGTWDYNGGAAPALITPTAYPALIRPLMFYDAAVTLGGTPSIAGNKLSIASGTAITRLRSIEATVDHGVDTEGFRITRDPTRLTVPPGARRISLSLEQDWSTEDMTFYNAWRASTESALDIDLKGPLITGSYYHEAHITFPRLHFNPAELPPVSGDEAPRMQPISAQALLHAATGVSMGIWIRTSEATL